MDEALAKKMLEILSGTEEFIVEQAPDVVRQLLTFKAVEHLLLAIFTAALVVAMCWTYSMISKGLGGEFIDYAIVGCMFAIVGCIVIPALVINVIGLIKVLVAPKFYLLEYFGKIVSG